MDSMLQSVVDSWEFLSEEQKKSIVLSAEAFKKSNEIQKEKTDMENRDALLILFFPYIVQDERLIKLIHAIYDRKWMNGVNTDIELSDELSTGFKKDTLNRLVKKELNMTPLEMKHKINHFKATTLLLKTTTPLRAIAKDCGFDSVQKFKLKFKEWSNGLTPEEYIAKNKKL